MGRLRDAVKRVTPTPVRTALRQKILNPLRYRFPQRVLIPLGIGPKLVPEAELRGAYERALDLLADGTGPPELGDYVEFGVCHGTSMTCMAHASKAAGVANMRLIGFDSFEGLPEGVENEDGGEWRSGDFRSSERLARRNLKSAGVTDDRYVLVRGWFEDTATSETAARLGVERVSVAMIDCDVYSSAVTSLAFLAPLLADRAVLFFDDWNAGGLAEKGAGERRAFDEFLAAHPEYRVVDELDPYTPNAHVVVLARRETPRG
jgi:O-methyltransferase